MKCGLLSLTFLFFSSESVTCFSVTDGNNLAVASTEPAKEGNAQKSVDVDRPHVNPEIYSMQIHANVSNRFARTLITSKMRNLKKNAEETTFSVVLPENAFISEFEMEIDGKIYKAYVKEKEEAKKIYEEAVSSGQSAAHVELSARDSKTFTVSVNIEPEGKTIFRLIYEELLQRQNGQYELIINIHPGQTVEDLGVQVYINESRPLTFVRTPSLRTGNEISKNDEKLDPSAKIDIVSSNSAIVKFSPDISQQKTFAEGLGSNKENGLAGQFVVQYEVERDPQGGEVLVRDGYFVHFFAPSELKPLPKHVVFVLDHSASMTGRKIDQLIDAMQNILSELKTQDLFHIVRFSDEASVWSNVQNKFVTVTLDRATYGHHESYLKDTNLPEAVEATDTNIIKAKNIVKDKSEMGLTNIMAGLEVGQFLIKKTQETKSDKYQSMIIFLTDGQPNVGIYSGEEITNTVNRLNSGKNRTAIFSLSFGNDADKEFLKKLSSQNLGFSRHIYEAADASLQLQHFYSKISSPLLTNITFKYTEGISEVTKTNYPILFDGSELVVAGKIGQEPNIPFHVYSWGLTGPITFNTTRTEPVSSLERLWAYLTVKQILKKRETAVNTTELSKKALDLSLQYSFVTKVSSLVVVKPNKTNVVDTNNIVLRQGRQFLPRFGGSGNFMTGRRIISSSPQQAVPVASRAMIPVRGRTSSYHIPRFDLDNYPSYFPRNHFHRGPSYHRTTQRPSTTIDLSTPEHLNYYVTSQSPSTTTYPSTTVLSVQNSTIPSWLDQLIKDDINITTSLGTFKLGQKGTITTHPDCPKTPNNSTGVCTIILDCPQVFSFLTDINVYLQYFCSLNEFAGVCCPQK